MENTDQSRTLIHTRKNHHVPAPLRYRPRLKIIRDDFDKPFLMIVCVLLVFGIAMMFSASYVFGLNSAKADGFQELKDQAGHAGIGLLAMLGLSFLDYHFFSYKKFAHGLFYIALGLCFMTLFFGKEESVAGARRWLDLGFVTIQPSEILKITFIILFTFMLSVRYPTFKKKFAMLPFMTVLGISCGVVALQRHLSALLIFFAIGISMMLIGGIPWKSFGKMMLLFGALGVVMLIVMSVGSDSNPFSYVTDRLKIWRNPLADSRADGYQTTQSLIAIGSGGLFGLGFGQSRQKYLYLPEAQNDFIFSIICEELGFVGAMVVILLFLLFIVRGFVIASRAKDRFGMLLTAGITLQIAIQALLNIMVAINAFPNTGVSLPFFSSGGSALVIQLSEMGIILSVSRQGLAES
ncbi:MAG: putative peptidoglycan glycosyltransferase FtsW [Oscillospiraceae bacterium]